MTGFRRNDQAEAPNRALNELETALAGLLRLAVLLTVDLSGVSGASASAFDEAVEEAETRGRTLLMDSSLSERQREILQRCLRLLPLTATLGRCAPHLRYLTTFLTGGPMGEPTAVFLQAVRASLAACGTQAVHVARSRDIEMAFQLEAALRDAATGLRPGTGQFLEAVQGHNGAFKLSRAACYALDVIWGCLGQIAAEYARDLSRTAEPRDGLLSPLRRAA
jgi:hypothetical protein